MNEAETGKGGSCPGEKDRLGHTSKIDQTPVDIGGRCRIRTCDFHRVKVALYR